MSEARTGRIAFMTIWTCTCIALWATGCKVQVGKNVEPGAMAAKGAETWAIDGKTYSIGSTYYIVLHPGERLQYTIEYLTSDPHLVDGLNDESAAEIAMPLMKHAWKQRLFDRSTVTSATGGTLNATLIGVAITYREGVRSRGFRVQRSIDQIAAQN
jgi:hypothetical protein